MIKTPENECPHILKNNLISIEIFKLKPFDKLKCQKCNENKNLLICLICGEIFCSNNSNNHFTEHFKENIDHCLFINKSNLTALCMSCQNKRDNSIEKSDNKEFYIQSSICEEYLNIIENCMYGDGDCNKDNIDNVIFKTKDTLCSHIKDENIIEQFNETALNYFKNEINFYSNNKNKNNNLHLLICLSCGEDFKNIFGIEEHFEFIQHKLFIDFINWTVICFKCESKYKLELLNNINKYKYLFQILKEKNLNIPIQRLTTEEIYEIKYQKFIKDFKNNKFSKILFMIGAGISTAAGIPDFRSKTGLFKQLQDKYKLSTPEEFFEKETFLKKPEYFYEFTKLFNLDKIKPTISHIFINYLVNKNIVKYILTQNIDGLEEKAKIPEEKLIYAHGNFFNGHCPVCNIPIDIQKINNCIKRGKIYYCPKCFGPCKPNIVFYGEKLPSRFFEVIKELKEKKDIDLIIIMGTSLKVHPFANIPKLINPNIYKVIFNMDKVGDFNYEKITNDSVFIQGKTDENVIRFLKDSNLYKEFEEFVKNIYNEDIDKILLNSQQKEIKLYDKIDELIKDIKNNIYLDDYK